MNFAMSSPGHGACHLNHLLSWPRPPEGSETISPQFSVTKAAGALTS